MRHSHWDGDARAVRQVQGIALSKNLPRWTRHADLRAIGVLNISTGQLSDRSSGAQLEPRDPGAAGSIYAPEI